MSEPLIRLLAELPAVVPNPTRADQIRRICRARLAQQMGRASSKRTSAHHSNIAEVWRPVVACLGVAYLTEVIVLALRVYSPR